MCKYHASFYHPENLCVIVTGQVNPDDVLLELSKYEEKIVSKVDLFNLLSYLHALFDSLFLLLMTFVSVSPNYETWKPSWREVSICSHISGNAILLHHH